MQEKAPEYGSDPELVKGADVTCLLAKEEKLASTTEGEHGIRRELVSPPVDLTDLQTPRVVSMLAICGALYFG